MDMGSGLIALVDKAKADYKAWWGDKAYKDAHVEKMINDYNDSIVIEEGSKYYKIITKSAGNASVHCFVVKADGKKFRAGDILKAASWRAPATNFARGNVLDGTIDRIRWTGAL